MSEKWTENANCEQPYCYFYNGNTAATFTTVSITAVTHDGYIGKGFNAGPCYNLFNQRARDPEYTAIIDPQPKPKGRGWKKPMYAICISIIYITNLCPFVGTYIWTSPSCCT
jgi:hypothetical protein